MQNTINEQVKQYTSNNLPPFWRFRETPGHGYLLPSREANANVPDIFRTYEYEEDCAYAIPIMFNPDLFTDETVQAATQTVKNWFPEDYEKHFGVDLQRGESSIKDQQYFLRIDNLGKYESFVGYGDWCFDIPKGYVYRGVRKIVRPDKKYKIGPQDGPEIYVLIKNEIDKNQKFWSEEEFELYNRDETYYTWNDYTKATGKERYK